MIRTFIIACLLLVSLNLQAAPANIGFIQNAASSVTIAVVQTQQGTAVATTAGVTMTSTGAGHALHVTVAGYNGNFANHGVSDNINGTTGWVRAGGVQNGSGDPECISLWHNYVGSAGVTTITVNAGVGAVITIGIAYETSGDTAWAGAGEAATNAQTATTNPQTGTVTNATATSIYFACLDNNDGSGNPVTMTINGTGTVGTWIMPANGQYLNGSSLFPVSMPYIIVSTSTARVHGWTTANKSTATVIAAYH